MSGSPPAPEFSLVLPFFNEEAGAAGTVSGLSAALRGAGFPYELVLVDNGSTDLTGGVLARCAEEDACCRVVRVPVNEGYGWGILNGLSRARGRFVGYMAADGQIAPSDMLRVFGELRSGSCRVAKVERVRRHDGPCRKVVSAVYNSAFRLLFGTPARDVNGTPKMLLREDLETLGLASKDWFIDAELMLKASALGWKVAQVGVEFLPRRTGSSKVRMSAIFEFMINMARCRLGGGMHPWKTSR